MVLFHSFLPPPPSPPPLLFLSWEQRCGEPNLPLCGNIGFTCLRHQLLGMSACVRARCAYNEGMTVREEEERKRSEEGRSGIQ